MSQDTKSPFEEQQLIIIGWSHLTNQPYVEFVAPPTNTRPNEVRNKLFFRDYNDAFENIKQFVSSLQGSRLVPEPKKLKLVPKNDS